MKLSLTLLVSALGYAAASSSSTSNPFAPKVSKNSAKAAYAAKLMRGATPLRKLEENGEQEVDLTTYSIKFEKCQFVKQYAGGEGGNNNNNNKNGVDTILTIKRFVIFRLCPDSSCGSCNANYGEYIVNMDTYLEAALGYKQEVQEQQCETCNKCYEKAAQAAEKEANGEEAEEDDEAWMCANIDTSTCYAECQALENMEANGYLDASEFAQCKKLDYKDEYGNAFYAGATCAGSGSSFAIGIFTDEQCSNYDDTKDIETLLAANNNDANNNNNNNNGGEDENAEEQVTTKLSYHLLKQTYAQGECIASCIKEDENANNPNNDDGNQDDNAAEVNEMCRELYEASGKCESSHGFANGIADYENYDTQVRNEQLVCNFISNLKAGQYDQTGEIVISGGRTTIAGLTSTSGGQKFALAFFVLGSVGLAGYVGLLHSQLTKGASKVDLSGQGGAMA